MSFPFSLSLAHARAASSSRRAKTPGKINATFFGKLNFFFDLIAVSTRVPRRRRRLARGISTLLTLPWALGAHTEGRPTYVLRLLRLLRMRAHAQMRRAGLPLLSALKWQPCSYGEVAVPFLWMTARRPAGARLAGPPRRPPHPRPAAYSRTPRPRAPRWGFSPWPSTNCGRGDQRNEIFDPVDRHLDEEDDGPGPSPPSSATQLRRRQLRRRCAARTSVNPSFSKRRRFA